MTNASIALAHVSLSSADELMGVVVDEVKSWRKRAAEIVAGAQLIVSR